MRFNRRVLNNGLVVLHERRDVPVTTVMLATRFGGIYESRDEKGIAHFIEHLSFKGTEKRTSKQIVASLEKVGGVVNAFTDEELTAYHVKLPSQHLELAMEIIFDMFFNPIFPEEDVEKESNVICEEIRMCHDQPHRRVLEKVKECLYEEPFGMSVAGTESNVRGMNREQLMKKHNELYVPENAILCVVGNNDFDDILKLAEEFCIKRKGKKPEIPEIRFTNSSRTEERKELQQANLAIGFHFPKNSDKRKYAAEIFSAILGRGMSSKLFTEVREKRGLVYTVRTLMDTGKDYGYMVIYAGTDKDKVAQVIDVCIDEFKNMKNISEKELEEAKKQVVGNYEVISEDSESVAHALILEEMAGDAREYYNYKKNIENVSLDDVRKIADLADCSYYVLSP